MSNKKALLVIGGITYKNYAFGDLIKHPEAQKYDSRWHSLHSTRAMGSTETNYAVIKEVNCEEFLDKEFCNFMSRFLLLGLPFRLWDRFGDYFKIICNEKVMRRVTGLVESEVKDLKTNYSLDVDVIAHSLGTLILLASKVEINTAYLLGSPLTSRHWSIRTTANNFANKHSALLAKFIYYCYSKNDLVGTNPQHQILCNNVDCEPVSHAFSEYLDLLLQARIIRL